MNQYSIYNDYLIKQYFKKYVCNNWSKLATYTNEKNYYRSKVIDIKYKELLVTGIEGLYTNIFIKIILPRKMKYSSKKYTLSVIKELTNKIRGTINDFF